MEQWPSCKHRALPSRSPNLPSTPTHPPQTKLQNTMLEQLSLFKSKLHQVEQENLTLRTALASSAAAASARAAAEPRISRRSADSPLGARAATGGGSSGAGDGGGGGGEERHLGAGVLAAMQGVRAAAGFGVSAGGSSTTTTATTLTQMLSLKDSGFGTSGGGAGGGSITLRPGGTGGGGGSGGGAGAGAGGSALFRSESSSLGFEDSRSDGLQEGPLGQYDM